KEERQRSGELGLQRRVFGDAVFLVGRDAVSSVHGAAAVGLVGVLIVVLALVAAVIFPEGAVRVVSLNEPPARRVVLRDGQQERGVSGQGIGGLDEPFPEGVLAEDPGAIMILQSAG